MEIKQKYQLSKVVKVLEKVVSEDSQNGELFTPKQMFHSRTNYRKTDTEYYEEVLNLIYRELFNIVLDLEYKTEEYKTILEVVKTLKDVMNEDKEVYYYTVTDSTGEHEHTTDREGHVIGILEWALDYIVGNIDVGVIE